VGLSGSQLWGVADGETKAAPSYTWTASASREPKPWGVQLSYSGSAGESRNQQFDALVQYQQEGFGVQLGAGAILTRQPGTPAPRPAYRASAALSLAPPSGSSPPSAGAPSWQVQLRLSGAASPSLSDGVPSYRVGAGLSGSASYASGPYSLSLSSSLNYAAWNLAQPWSGEFGVQGLYKLSDRLQLNLSGRFRPATASSTQVGAGLRYNF
jgi:hypothetical protein